MASYPVVEIKDSISDLLELEPWALVINRFWSRNFDSFPDSFREELLVYGFRRCFVIPTRSEWMFHWCFIAFFYVEIFDSYLCWTVKPRLFLSCLPWQAFNFSSSVFVRALVAQFFSRMDFTSGWERFSSSLFWSDLLSRSVPVWSWQFEIVSFFVWCLIISKHRTKLSCRLPLVLFSKLRLAGPVLSTLTISLYSFNFSCTWSIS